MFFAVCNRGSSALFFFFCKGKLSLVIPAFLCFLHPIGQLLWSPHDPDASLNVFSCLGPSASWDNPSRRRVLLSLWLECSWCSDTWWTLRWTPLSLNQAGSSPQEDHCGSRHPLAGPFSRVVYPSLQLPQIFPFSLFKEELLRWLLLNVVHW